MLLVRGIGRQGGNLDPYCIMRFSKITVSQRGNPVYVHPVKEVVFSLSMQV